MSTFIFDSTKEEYKSPFGAVTTGQSIFFSIKIQECHDISSVRFVYHAPDIWQSVSMSNSMQGLYSCTISIDQPNVYLYHFEVDTPTGVIFIGNQNGAAAAGYELAEWQLTVYSSDFSTPDWVKGGIMYHIFPDRFCRDKSYHLPPAKNTRIARADWSGIPQSFFTTPNYKANDFFCGNIQGVISQLDYIKSLGTNMIYMNPIFESAENHRYSTGDYLTVDPWFGTGADFDRLTAECTKHGIGLLLDGVFSHTGADSIYFNKFGSYDSIGAYNSTDSPYASWFKFTEFPDNYESWWGFENLPNVEESDLAYMAFVDGVLSHWQKKGARGWRLDVVDELPDIFIDRLRRQIKQNDADAFIIGEVWEDASNKESYGIKRRYLLGGQLDSVMNYPWRTAIIDYVLFGDAILFKNRIMSIVENYPSPVLDCLMNILSTHDTPRIINVLGVESTIPQHEKPEYRLSSDEYSLGKERLKIAAFLQFTLPGIPSIYYGDEVGLQGFEDPYCRTCYPFGCEDNELLNFFKALAEIRLQNKSCFSHGFTLLYAENGAVAFERSGLICIVNTGNESAYIPCTATEILYNQGDIATNDNNIQISAKSFGILK